MRKIFLKSGSFIFKVDFTPLRWRIKYLYRIFTIKTSFYFWEAALKKAVFIVAFRNRFCLLWIRIILLQITPLDKKNGGFDDTELQVLDDSSTKSTKNVETNTEMPKSKNFKLQVGQNLKLTILKGGDRKKSHQVCLVI